MQVCENAFRASLELHDAEEHRTDGVRRSRDATRPRSRPHAEAGSLSYLLVAEVSMCLSVRLDCTKTA